MGINESFYYRYGPESLFEYVRLKLKEEEGQARVDWFKGEAVQKCSIPPEVYRLIKYSSSFGKHKLIHVVLNQAGKIQSIVLRVKHLRVSYYVEYGLSNFTGEHWIYRVKFIGPASPYSAVMSSMGGVLFDKAGQMYAGLLRECRWEEAGILPGPGTEASGEAEVKGAGNSEDTPEEGENLPEQPQRPASRIKGIQFDKRLLNGVPLEETAHFCKTMVQKLAYIERFVSGELTAAGKTLRFLRRGKGRQALKYRLGKRRFSMLLNNGILTCIGLSTHDRQIHDIETFQVKQAGMVYYELEEFLERIKSYDAASRIPLGKFLLMPRHYVLSQDQQEILSSKESSLNMSIVGNAGAGKSLIGMKWIAHESGKEHNKCLYLTMSMNLVYALREQFEMELAEESRSDCQVTSVGEFIYSRMKLAYAELPDRCFLDTKESFEVFRSFWGKKISKDPRQMMDYWRAIHGYLKGAIPHEMGLKGKIRVPDYIDEDEYVRLREMAGEDNYPSWDESFKIYLKYQEHLRFANLYDDNDLAKMLISANKWKKEGYSSVFLDECQDLTQVQLLALLCQLRGTRSKVFASDRCQMVQPVWFKEGYMRTLANELDRCWGKKVEAEGIKAHYLHYNFRSTRRIIAFQNEVVDFFRDNTILSLKHIEMKEIQAPAPAMEGSRPIWIRCSSANEEQVTRGLWQKLTGLDLQPIIANRSLPTLNLFGPAGRLAVDVVECKGMEYPSVLMFNVMADVRRDAAMAWKYFYVAATRSSDVLIIYDDLIESEALVRDFFLRAVARGSIEECPDLLSPRPNYEGTWLKYIEAQVMRPKTDEEMLATAGTAMDYEQYSLAHEIYRQLKPEAWITLYCQGKIQEQEKNYSEAVRTYAELAYDWQDRGRNRQNSVDALLRAPDIEKEDYLAALIISRHEQANFLAEAHRCYEEKYGEDQDFQNMLWLAMEKHDFVPDMMYGWMDAAYRDIEENMEVLQHILNTDRGGRLDA